MVILILREENKMPTLKQVEHFHRRKKKIPNIVLSVTDKNEIIYGARALNKQLPSYLNKPTEDYDIFSPTPKKDAMQTEKALDNHFGGDYFYVEPAKHEGTWKVKSKINKEGYVDYTKPENKIPFRMIGGKKYVKLDYVKAHIKKTLKDKEAKYRHDKDRDALNRIRVYENLKNAKKGSYNKKKRQYRKRMPRADVIQRINQIAGFKS